jgi:hypothetical protein
VFALRNFWCQRLTIFPEDGDDADDARAILFPFMMMSFLRSVKKDGLFVEIRKDIGHDSRVLVGF